MDPSDTDPQVSFGLALPMVGNGLGTRRFVAELLDEVTMAEQEGFDLCLVPEHHGGPNAALSDPLTTVGWLLARTSRIRVGTGVLVLPLHSIPRLAEQTAVLQNASGGRLVLGVGAGYQAGDFATFGVDLSSRGRLMTDGIEMLKQAWRSGELAGHAVRPTLSDVPSPPVLVGAWSDAGIRRAARQADGWIADPIRSVAETERLANYYCELARGGGHVVVMREAWLGDSDEAAAATFGPVIEPIFRYYLRNGAFESGHGLTEADIRVDGCLQDRLLCGSPETVADRIVDLVSRTRARTVVLGLRHPAGPAHDDVLAVIERLGQMVFPAVRARLAGERSGSHM